jgi:hypothetical protein
MERDTTVSVRSATTSDTVAAETSASSTDSAAVATAQIDTAAAGYAEMARDTSSAANADVSVETGVATGDVADTTGNADRIRSAEDSTEILGQMGSVTTTDEAADETADEQIITPDSEPVATSESRTDEVGAAAVGGHVTGAEAVGLMTRAGVRCAVADPEANEAVRWDMSNTPATLNPCGMGSMILSRIWTRVE